MCALRFFMISFFTDEIFLYSKKIHIPFCLWRKICSGSPCSCSFSISVLLFLTLSLSISLFFLCTEYCQKRSLKDSKDKFPVEHDEKTLIIAKCTQKQKNTIPIKILIKILKQQQIKRKQAYFVFWVQKTKLKFLISLLT